MFGAVRRYSIPNLFPWWRLFSQTDKSIMARLNFAQNACSWRSLSPNQVHGSGRPAQHDRLDNPRIAGKARSVAERVLCLIDRVVATEARAEKDTNSISVY
jgi:hypothetical protein